MSKTIYAAAVLFFCFCQFTASAGWQSYGPYGGNVTCLTVSGSTIFAGCGYNGIYLSSDSGANWKEVISGLAPSTSVNSLASCNNGNIFAGTSTGVYLYNYNSATWNLAGLGQLTVQCLQTFGGSVVAYAYSGLDTSTCTLLMSTDNGNTWNYTGFTYLGKVNALAASDQYLYAATDTGIYVSSDSAESWTLTLSNEFYTNKTIVLAANRGNIVTGTTQGAIYFSSDHGFNWLQIDTANFNFQNGLVINTLVFGDSGIFIAARNASAGCEIILTGYNNDNSANVSAGISPLLTISAFAFSGSNIFAATTAGVYISTDYGGNWHPVNNGMLNVTISALTANATNIFAGGADGMYGSANHGARWTPLDSGLGNIYNPDFLFVTALCANYSGIFAGTMPGNIYVSHNNGVSWINIGGAPLTGGIFSLYTDSATIYAVAGGDLFISYNNGETWYGLLITPPVGAFAANAMSMYAATPLGLVVSNDSGYSWYYADSGHLYSDEITAIAVQHSNIFVSSYVGFYSSFDNGLNWNELYNGSPLNRVFNQLLSYGANVFGISDYSIFISPDSGVSWTDIGAGLPAGGVTSIAIDGENLYASTLSNSVWQRPLGEVTAIPTVSPPINIKLYPNPNNGTFMLDCPGAALHQVQVSDLAGRVILSAQSKNAHQQFNLQSLSSGVYIIQVRGQDQVSSLKFSVAK